MIRGKNVLLCLSGGIAAYKAAELCRLLIKEGAHVRVVMTKNACEFITPLTLKTLSGNRVYTDMFCADSSLEHINLTNWAQVLLVAPATANIMAKLAHGMADDLLSTIFLSRGSTPLVLAPAMNCEMYANSVFQENLGKIKKQGVFLVEPATGELACGVVGQGRMAEPQEIVEQLTRIIGRKNDLQGMRVLITAGPTREPFDPVRFISNYASGKMGFALATAAWERGGDVILVSGPTTCTAPRGINVQQVETTMEMFSAVTSLAPQMDVIIKAAAVSDFRPASTSEQKIKKEGSELQPVLKRNPDILKTLGERKKEGQILVGFAAETENLLANAAVKLKEKNLDLIAANDVSKSTSGFAVDTNALTLLFPGGAREEVPLGSKAEIAHKVLDAVVKIKTPAD